MGTSSVSSSGVHLVQPALSDLGDLLGDAVGGPSSFADLRLHLVDQSLQGEPGVAGQADIN